MRTWDKFWKNKGKIIEWNKEDILKSKNLNNLASELLRNIKKDNFKKVELLELGSGIGLTSYFFATKGAKVTLLDNSKEARMKAKDFWGDMKYNFILADLFRFNSKKKYNIVTSFGLCEHFIGKQREEVLQKHISFLKKGGIAVISVPYKFGIFYRLSKFLAEIVGLWAFGQEVPFSKRELISFAKKNELDYKITVGGFWSSAYDLFSESH